MRTPAFLGRKISVSRAHMVRQRAKGLVRQRQEVGWSGVTQVLGISRVPLSGIYQREISTVIRQDRAQVFRLYQTVYRQDPIADYLLYNIFI